MNWRMTLWKSRSTWKPTGDDGVDAFIKLRLDAGEDVFACGRGKVIEHLLHTDGEAGQVDDVPVARRQRRHGECVDEVGNHGIRA